MKAKFRWANATLMNSLKKSSISISTLWNFTSRPTTPTLLQSQWWLSTLLWSGRRYRSRNEVSFEDSRIKWNLRKRLYSLVRIRCRSVGTWTRYRRLWIWGRLRLCKYLRRQKGGRKSKSSILPLNFSLNERISTKRYFLQRSLRDSKGQRKITTSLMILRK